MTADTRHSGEPADFRQADVLRGTAPPACRRFSAPFVLPGKPRRSPRRTLRSAWTDQREGQTGDAGALRRFEVCAARVISDGTPGVIAGVHAGHDAGSRRKSDSYDNHLNSEVCACPPRCPLMRSAPAPEPPSSSPSSPRQAHRGWPPRTRRPTGTTATQPSRLRARRGRRSHADRAMGPTGRAMG